MIDASFFSIPLTAQGITLTGGDIFTANNSGSVSAYNASTAATVGNPLISILGGNPEMITSSGSVLYVTDSTAGTIGSYTTTGTAISPSLVPLTHAFGVTYFNNALYATTDDWHGTITAYDLSGHPLAGFTTISNPWTASYSGLVVLPEPGTVGLVAMGGLAMAFGFLKRRRR